MPGNQASGVPRQDGRRARLESEDGTDQSAATHIRVEKARQPQWTMCSTVEDILLEGSTNRTDMKLNDFLRSNLGEEWILDTNENVTMQEFVQDPEMFLKNEILLRTIKASPSYQVLEAINKLHPEGVFSLEQWWDYERKDTITPFPRGKLKGVLTQVQRERREAEERLIREEEERRRRAQKMKFTISANIEDVLFKGEFRYREMELNDFLLLRFGGKGVMDANRSVLLEEFFKEPARYIRVKGVLNEIKKTDRFLRMEWTVKKEMNMEEDVSKLQQAGVDNLMTWLVASAEVKATVHCITKGFLDAAAEEARSSMTTSAPIYLEGLYESVYNARWNHVVEVPDGDGTGMEVKEGKPKQSWTYKKAGQTFEKDDGVRQSGATRLRLMVLTSDKAWPCTWNRKGVESTRDCYVNCEVERVWRIVLGDLTKWSSSHGKADFTPERRVLGRPGSGSRWLPVRTPLPAAAIRRENSKWLFTLLRIEHFCLTRPAGRCRRTRATPVMRLL
ncbi:putative retrotransposon hot spot (RHS) protein [Trypanosoma cruzi]|uniref:Putative retrotransposon hot spot (RHS) protein n=1 Tax=Trypanosoma cruzi TaxID=5693 RepID=A0A2V2UPA4_TRYCR|nr:putative retrotransposon hot spot (RHS) protein [Trypanosoma cruzi]